MTNLGSSQQKRAWLLVAYCASSSDQKVPVEIFVSPTDCFKKYPGLWGGEKTSFYYLTKLDKFERFQGLDCIYLESYPFTPASYVTT